MPIVNTSTWNTTCFLFCTQGTVFMVHLIRLGLSLKVNHTYARQGGAHFTIPKLRFNNEIIPASIRYTHPLLRAFFST